MTNLIYKLLDKLFYKEVIDDRYLIRWHLTRRDPNKSGWFLHHFIGSDPTTLLHDHPKDFLSIGLLGSYTEEVPWGFKFYRAPWIRRFQANYKHRIMVKNNKSCWTIVRYGPVYKEWGFFDVYGNYTHHSMLKDRT